MQIYNEDIQYEDPLLFIKIFESRFIQDCLSCWHYHDELELLVMLNGNLDLFIEDDIVHLTTGDVVIIGSNQLHRVRGNQETVATVLQFNTGHYFELHPLPYYRLFPNSGFPLHHVNYIFQDRPETKALMRQLVQEIWEETTKKPVGYEIAIAVLIKKIVLTLLRHDTKNLLSPKTNFNLKRLKPVLDFIELNISRKILVEEACGIINFSPHHFMKMFKKTIGVSFLDYVNLRKIKLAERYLLTQDMSIAQIGESVGMPNMAHFYDVFRKHNKCSPNEYRKKMLAVN